jgi:hypothetical protein
MSIIETKDLGLAAFVKSRGFRLLACENRVFKQGLKWKSNTQILVADNMTQT